MNENTWQQSNVSHLQFCDRYHERGPSNKPRPISDANSQAEKGKGKKEG